MPTVNIQLTPSDYDELLAIKLALSKKEGREVTWKEILKKGAGK